ncbi:MAG: hypothetical protein ACRBFS_26200 [Aureispira sp.]
MTVRQLTVLMALSLLFSCTTDATNPPQEPTTVEPVVTEKKVQQKKETDLSKKNLKGAVKKRVVWVYASDETGKMDENALKGGVEVTYNEAGNKLDWKSYDGKKQLLEAWNFIYNEKGQLKEKITTNDAVVRQMYYRYNSEKQIEHTEEHSNGTMIKATSYRYNDAGNLVWSHSFFEGSSSESKRKQRYNAKNQLLELQVYDEHDVVQLKKVFGYNEQGYISEQAIYSGSNVPSYKRQLVYDEQGNCTKDWAYQGDGKRNERDAFNYHYTYDEQGNWRTKTKTTPDNKPLEYSTQTLVYFK